MSGHFSFGNRNEASILMRRKLSSVLLFTVSGCGLLMFILIWLNDAVKVCEPNLVIRILETSMFAIFWGFSIYNLVKEGK